MTTVEIAERTGKEHKHVLRDARLMLDALGVRSDQFWANVPDAYGRDRDALALPKRECLILVSGYSVELRAAIIDRWQELEQAQAPRIPTHQEALRLAADERRLVNRHDPALPAGKPMVAVTAITPHTRRTDIPHPSGVTGNYPHH